MGSVGTVFCSCRLKTTTFLFSYKDGAQPAQIAELVLREARFRRLQGRDEHPAVERTHA
jgi:hypothetical protein